MIDLERICREAGGFDLPACESFFTEDGPSVVFSKADLARLVNAVLEEAAKKCDKEALGHWGTMTDDACSEVAKRIADAIRDLKVKQ